MLKFWAKIQRSSRGSHKLNTRRYENLAFFRRISHFISKTVQDTAIVTMEDEQELLCDLSNGAISNDLE